MSYWTRDIVWKHKKLIGTFIDLWMSRACMLQLAIIVVEANTLNVNVSIVFWLLDLNLKWMIDFNKSKCSLSVLNHGSVGCSILMPFKGSGIVTYRCELLSDESRQNSYLRQMLEVRKIRLADLILMLVLSCSAKSIAVVKLPIRQTKCM